MSDCLHESFRSTKEADEKEGEGKKKARMKRVDRRRAFLPGCYRSIKQTSDFPSSSSSLRSRSLSRNFAYIRGEKVEDRFKHNIRPSKRAKSAPFPETRFFLFEHRSKFDNDSRRKRERRKKDSKRISWNILSSVSVKIHLFLESFVWNLCEYTWRSNGRNIPTGCCL